MQLQQYTSKTRMLGLNLLSSILPTASRDISHLWYSTWIWELCRVLSGITFVMVSVYATILNAFKAVLADMEPLTVPFISPGQETISMENLYYLPRWGCQDLVFTLFLVFTVPSRRTLDTEVIFCLIIVFLWLERDNDDGLKWDIYEEMDRGLKS